MKLSRRTAVVALTACCAATAAPALAATETEQVKVSLTVDVGGSRQFDALEETANTSLKKLDLGTAGTKAFRTRVTDDNFEALGKTYSVTATMSNLYRRTALDAATGATTNDVATKIASNQLSLTNTAPYAEAPVIGILPQLTVSGTLGSCADLPDPVKTALGLPLDLTALTTLLADLTAPLRGLCTELASGTQAVTGPVDGVLQTVNSTVTDVTKLPTVVTNVLGSKSFDKADYDHDATALTEPSSVRTATTPTGIAVMNGNPATDVSAAALLTEVDALLATKIAGKSLTDLVPLPSLRALVADSGLEAEIAKLTTVQQTALLGQVVNPVVTAADPVLSRLRLSTNTYAKPVLNATLTAPVSGTYDGTMTLTFVQT